MTRFALVLAAAVAAGTAARGHMVYVVPAADGKSVTVVFSDTLDADEKVAIDKVAGLKLTARPAGGEAAPVELTKEPHKLTGTLPGGPGGVAFGTVVYGLMSKSEKPTLLVYHPKVVVPSATTRDAKALTAGDAAALEIVPVAAGGKTRFLLLAKGKPVAGAEGGYILPDGTKGKATTDADGYTPAFDQTGRYAVWLKQTEAKAGEHAGKKYEAVRHYATLVADVAK